MVENKIGILLYCCLAGSETTSLLFKEQRPKSSRMGFWKCHVTPREALIDYALSLREIITYCHRTEARKLRC